MDNSRTRVGSPNALNIRASRRASSMPNTSVDIGTQHADSSVVITGSSVVMVPTLPNALTSVDISIIIDMTRYSPALNGTSMINDIDDNTSDNDDLREQIRVRYAGAATAVKSGTRNANLLVGEGFRSTSCCGGAQSEKGEVVSTTEQATSSCCGADASSKRSFGAGLYDAMTTAGLPIEAVEASLGCGNPTAVAELREGERVLDLGSGGGIDVLLSARRVGESGLAYGVDMTDEMLDLARENAAKSNLKNVEFLKGTIEDVPLPDGAVDVVISNCVINLSVDKQAVFAEMFRVLSPGGRIGVSDVVAEDRLTPAQRARRGSYVGCIAGSLSCTEYLEGLSAAGFTDATVDFTHEAADGIHSAIIRAIKPAA